MIALDASALLAFLFREAGHEAVAKHIERSCISAVNLAEVLGRFARDRHDPEAVLAKLSATAIEIVPFGPRDAAAAAALVPLTRKLGLSLGDRACLALAKTRGIAALTADRAWADLDIAVAIEVVR